MRIEKCSEQNEKSSYQVSFDYINDQGQLATYVKTFPTQHEAGVYSMNLSAKLRNSLNMNQDKIHTLNSIYQEWLEIDSIRLAPNTKYSYTHHYERFIQPAIGNMDIKEISYPVLQKLFNTFTNHSASTIGLIRSSLKNVLDYAQKAGYISGHCLDLIYVHSDKKVARRQMYLEKKDFLNLCDHLQDEPAVVAYLYLGYYLGLRRAEALALCFSDINFENNTVEISRQMDFTSKRKKDFKTTTPKTDSSIAVLPVCSALKTFLLKYRTIHPYDLIVSNAKGDFMVPTTIHHKISVVVKKLGMDFHYHMLRHTYVTNLMRSGAHPKTVAKLARHSSVNTTLNVYTEVSQAELQTALDQAFSNE